MQKRVFTALLCVIAVSLSGFAAQKKSAKKSQAAGPAPDKAYMQKIWDGWSTLDPANVAQFYAQGPHVFFDIAPLKYDSWDEYQSGVKKELADYKSAKFTVNDDAQVHSAGNSYWATSTIKEDATLKNGKRELATWRWTVVFENQGGKWVIVHEHVSAPAQ
jgi:ketosteroid isomerase-like protein